MRVIDLLNKIANGKEVPKKIKWGAHEFEWVVYEYKSKGEFQEPTLLDYLSQAPSMLNDEVEIIEEPQKHKIPEKLDKRDFLNNETLDQVDADLDFIIDKINEIIDYLEKIDNE